MKKRRNTPLSLISIFSQTHSVRAVQGSSKHFVNHHSLLMMIKCDFYFDVKFGEYFVDGKFLKLILDILNVSYVFMPGPLYLENRLKHILPAECFFALANRCTSDKLQALGYCNSIVLPIINEENLIEITRNIVNSAHGRIVIMGIGSPNQDIVAQKIIELNNNLEVLCVGAACEFLAGTQKPAPSQVRSVGLEWLWRLITNFRVTFPRVTKSVFGVLILILTAKIKR